MILFDFTKDADLGDWRVVNDGVMGGLSQANFSINKDGHGFFTGNVSLENNGGFSSVRYAFETMEMSDNQAVKIRLKGDGKSYQFRVKASHQQGFSHIAPFKTSGEWETITIQFKDMYPAFRGRLLDLPNFEGEKLSEIAFLIGNKKKESFALEIDSIKLE